MSVRLSKSHVDKALRDVADGGRTYDIIDSQQPGLLLRVGPRGARWAFKIIRKRTTFRMTLGSPPGLTLDEARSIVAEAQRHIANRTDEPGDRFLEDQLIRLGKLPPRPAAQPRDPAMVAGMMEVVGDTPFWKWEAAREAYLAEVKRTLREATWKDYGAKLHLAELDVLAGRKVRRITLEDLAEIVAAVHSSGRETHAVNLASALRPLWRWLWKPHVRKSSGLGVEGIGADMSKLCAPPRTPGVKVRANGKVAGRYVGAPGEIGTVIAVARSGVLDPTVSLSLELLTLTAQRRRPIADARVEDFVPWIETPGWGCWSMAPAHRKTADKRSDQSRHAIPLPPALWSRVQAQLLRSAAAGTPYLFPQIRAWKLGDAVDGHMSDSALNHRLLDIGVRASPHDLRRGFSTHGQKQLRIPRADVKLVMDHAEGIASTDTLEGHYTDDDRLDLKGPVMEKWVAWCEAQAAIAAAALPPLNQLAAEIAARRRAREKDGKAKTAARKAAEAKVEESEKPFDLAA
ncbi:integrase family protein [Methylobacterium sp. J-077]|uniref:integrase family protein n=1 Tax=Methylobacterium sp. J-077 TaxID=2836656 RepID=UPI001FB878F7|nr:integrase family protein [Methylobacterium sp. J-077]MCJ2124364.1 integrase family protein [Methylobacterium sp. J-077]